MTTRRLGFGFIFISVLALCAAQVILKDRFAYHGSIPLTADLVDYLWVAARDVLFGAAVFCILLSSLSWYLGLSRLPLSLASPVTSLAYPIVLLTSFSFLGESVTIEKIVGNLFIVAGILVATLKPSN